jgi:hypothetical protein
MNSCPLTIIKTNLSKQSQQHTLKCKMGNNNSQRQTRFWGFHAHELGFGSRAIVITSARQNSIKPSTCYWNASCNIQMKHELMHSGQVSRVLKQQQTMSSNIKQTIIHWTRKSWQANIALVQACSCNIIIMKHQSATKQT